MSESCGLCYSYGGTYCSGAGGDCWTPILIDVQGNSFDLTNATNGVNFDDGSGAMIHTAWTAANIDHPDSLIKTNGVYRRLLRQKAFVEFSLSLLHTRTVNRLGHATRCDSEFVRGFVIGFLGEGFVEQRLKVVELSDEQVTAQRTRVDQTAQ